MFAATFTVSIVLPPLVGIWWLIGHRRDGFLRRTIISLLYVMLSTFALAVAIYVIFLRPSVVGSSPTPGVGVVYVPLVLGFILGTGVTLIGSLVTSLTMGRNAKAP